MILLDDIEEHTFIRFCQYAYCGDYTVPALDTIADPSRESVQSFDRSASNCSDPGNNKAAIGEKELSKGEVEQSTTLPRIAEDLKSHCLKSVENTSLLAYLRRRCRQVFSREPTRATPPLIRYIHVSPDSRLARLRLEFQRTSRALDASFKPPRNTHPQQSMAEILMSHARLYVFADRYDCLPLRKLVLNRLKLTLAAFMVFQERVGDFLSVVRYVYDNTPDKDESHTLLVEFGVCVVPIIVEHPQWRSFADTMPEYVKELQANVKKALGLKRNSFSSIST